MSSYKKKLDKIFKESPPNFLSNAVENLNERALLKQGIILNADGEFSSEIMHLNPVKLILDIHELNKERPEPVKKINKKTRQELAETYMRAEFYEFIYDNNKSNQQKIYKCFYYRNLLQAYFEVYKYEIIRDQQAFLKELMEKEEQYKSMLNDQDAKSDPVKFKEILSPYQQKQIETFVREEAYVNVPKLFVEYLVGNNNGEGFKVLPGKEDEICYLLYLLYHNRLIQLTSGRAYQQFIDSTICHFTQGRVKWQITSRVRKFKRGKKLKHSAGKDLNNFVQGLKK